MTNLLAGVALAMYATFAHDADATEMAVMLFGELEMTPTRAMTLD
jgi:hypothetical protein